MQMINVLFLCTGNSCRSQMADGWARHLKGDVLEPFSAGIETHGLNPRAVQVMAEAGVDISAHRSQHLDEFAEIQFDHVITVCGHAHEQCPVFPGTTRVTHAGFDDPPTIELIHGQTSRDKTIRISGLTADQLVALVPEP